MPDLEKDLINILYIGNNDDFSKQLESYPVFTVVKKENGLKAMDYLIREDKIDAVVSEVHLTGINGFEVAKHFKSQSGFNKIPFIIVSFEKNEAEKREALKLKGTIDDYYQTPVENRDLEIRIRFLQYYFKELSNRKVESKTDVLEYKIPVIKRLFDIVVSATALLILLPLFIIVAIAIKLESKGPVIYKSKRVGTGYRIFDFLKFRSMYTGADAKLKELEHLNQYAAAEKEKSKENKFEPCPRCAKLPEGQYCSPVLYIGGEKICEYWYKVLQKRKGSTFVKIQNDPRITKVGKIIRNTSIDELPQLINVLKGDMSIVGNRPLPLYEAEQLTSDDWSARFLGPAGITGLWQVELRGKGGVMSEEERKRLDNYYAQNYSFWGDIKLILRTIPALFQKENV
jgi:lipopolysaccharide/colanic/teichoic acid biosynthesis glycosyltransferase